MCRIGELFGGAGGLGLAAELAGAKNEWAIEINPHAAATYERNLGAHVICKDVRQVDFKQLPRVDGLLFGFPCNDFSLVGEQKGLDGDYGPLYKNCVRAVNDLRPLFFTGENVSGMSSANDGKAFAQIQEELGNAGPGYDIYAKLIKFEDYGVPQTRHRWLVIGIASYLGLSFTFPEPTTLRRPVTAAEALAGVEAVSWNNERRKEAPLTVERLRHIPPGANAWHPDLPEHLRLNVKPDGYRMSGIYRRLHPDKPSPTITASGGGGTCGYHWAEPRALTNRERARLQSFPDDFVFEGTPEQVRRQIGMAVPPMGAKVILEQVLKTVASATPLRLPA